MRGACRVASRQRVHCVTQACCCDSGDLSVARNGFWRKCPLSLLGRGPPNGALAFERTQEGIRMLSLPSHRALTEVGC